jgi:hypothetical protein
MMQASRRHPQIMKMPPPKEGTPGRQGTINFAYKQKAEKKLASWRYVAPALDGNIFSIITSE